MKKSQRYLNYALSIGFTMLVFLFLVLLVLISRVVLSDFSPISEHVMNTKNLLENIEEVEKVTQNNYSLESYELERLNKENSYFNVKVLDIHHRNLNDKSVLTVFFKYPIYNFNNRYYFQIENISEMKIDDLVIYENNKTGRVINIYENKIIIIDIDEKKIKEIDKNTILGKVFMILEND